MLQSGDSISQSRPESETAQTTSNSWLSGIKDTVPTDTARKPRELASNEVNSQLVSSLQFYSRTASVITFLVGCVVLVGWAFDSEVLKSFAISNVTMKPNTAIGFILLGGALWLRGSASKGNSDWSAAKHLAQACAVAVALLGMLSLGEWIFGWDLGTDQFLFHEAPGAFGTRISRRA